MWKMYANSKAANVFFSDALKELSETKNFEYSKILSSSLHPGAVYTDIFRTDGKSIWYKILIHVLYKPFMLLLFNDKVMGVQTTLHCFYISREEFVNGGYYKDCRIASKGESMRTNNLEQRIHKLSFEAVMNSPAFEDFKDDLDFKNFIEYFRKKFYRVILD